MPDIGEVAHQTQGANVVKLVSERRATDRLVGLWNSSGDKRSVFSSVSASPLWDHCFLFVVDDDLECSSIIDGGDQAAKLLSQNGRRITPLDKLPRALARRIHRLGLECRKERAPRLDACELGEEKELPIRRYRMALVPLARHQGKHYLARNPSMNMLGVFTYQ